MRVGQFGEAVLPFLWVRDSLGARERACVASAEGTSRREGFHPRRVWI
jgi:hypothetical protein